MAIFIQPVDPNVHYAGKILPAGRSVQYNGDPPVDPNVNYNGSILPQEGIKPTPFVVDLTNLPSLVVLGTLASVVSPFAGVVVNAPPVTGSTLANGGMVLPADVIIDHDLDKIVTQTSLLDGVPITEHIRRQPINIIMEFTIRARNGSEWTFGQQFLDDLYQKIILPSSVIYVQNTMLNKIGVTQLVLKKASGKTIRGSINQPMTLHFFENVPGQSLIVG